MNGHAIRPSAWWFALPAAVLVIGAVAFALVLVDGLMGITDGFTQVVVPGQAEVTLDEPGTYTIFHEYHSVVDGKVYSTAGDISGLRCRLVSKQTGAEVPLSSMSASMTYELGSRSGRAILECEIDQPGVYVLSAEYAEGQAGPEVVLALCRGFMKTLLFTIFGGLGIAFGSLAVAATIAIVVFVKRRKAKARLDEEPAPLPDVWR